MKVLLIQDVHKLGRAGDVKKVANGYGRNYLIPQGLAVLATPSALEQADHIRTQANTRRAIENQEMGGIAQQLQGVRLVFPARAGETGKLYGSITTQMIAEAIEAQYDVQIDRRQLDAQPIRTLGEHKVQVRLTIDLNPEISVLVHREGESAELVEMGDEAEVEAVVEAEAAEAVDELQPWNEYQDQAETPQAETSPDLEEA